MSSQRATTFESAKNLYESFRSTSMNVCIRVCLARCHRRCILGVAAADGSRFHDVHLLHPEWKSDSSHIIHTTSDLPSGIRIFDPSANSRAQLSDTDANYAVYSPDGRIIAYADDNQLRLMNANNTGHKTLVDGRAADLAWSPSGDKIAYASWEPSSLPHCKQGGIHYGAARRGNRGGLYESEKEPGL